MGCIHKMTVSYEPLKTLDLPSWSSTGFTVNDIGAGMGGCGLEGIMGDWRVGEWKADRWDRWGQAVRNSSGVEMLFLRIKEVSSLQVRVLADCC